QHAQPSGTNRPRGLTSPVNVTGYTPSPPVLLPLHQSCGRPRAARASLHRDAPARGAKAIALPSRVERYGRRGAQTTLAGGFGARDTPVPIPNTEVKPRSADG